MSRSCRIFSRSSGRLSRAPIVRNPGMGIGLAVVQQLVELHGGSVNAHSDGLGTGASFTIHLPRSVERKTLSEPALELSIDSLEGMHVLVVDDSEDTTEMVQLLVRDRRRECDCRYQWL